MAHTAHDKIRYDKRNARTRHLEHAAHHAHAQGESHAAGQEGAAALSGPQRDSTGNTTCGLTPTRNSLPAPLAASACSESHQT